MNLIEMSTPPSAQIPVRDFADHLRLGTGFADDGSQDGVLESFLRAAIAAIEARTGKVLLSKAYSWELTRWHSPERQGLPVGPVSAVNAVMQVAADGTETFVAQGYRLRPDLYRSELVGNSLPAIPVNGSIRIVFTAGFGPEWSDVPADLAQAVFMLAAQNYEARADRYGNGATMPFSVLALIERYKTVRLLGDVL